MLADVLSLYTGIIWQMIAGVKPYVNHLLWGLLGLDVVFMGINIATGKMSNIGHIIERLLFMGFLIYIVTNFTQLSTMFKDSFIKILGGGTVNVPGFSSTIYHNPSQIVAWAHEHLIAPMNEAIKHLDQAYNAPASPGLDVTKWGSYLSSQFNHMEDVWSIRLIFNLLFLGILIAFIIIAVEMTVAIIEFYLILLFSLVLVPFVAWQPLRFIGTRAFTAVIAQALKLGIIIAIVSLGMRVMNQLNAHLIQVMNPTDIGNDTVDLSVIGVVLTACAVLVFLSIQVPALAMALISGSPALSASGFAGNMAGIAGIGIAAAAGFRALGQSFSNVNQGSPQQRPSTGVTSTNASVSSAPTSGGTPGPGAQALFQTPPGASSGGPRGNGNATAAKVNPVSSETAVSGVAAGPADRMFQPVSSSGNSAGPKVGQISSRN